MFFVTIEAVQNFSFGNTLNWLDVDDPPFRLPGQSNIFFQIDYFCKIYKLRTTPVPGAVKCVNSLSYNDLALLVGAG
jgi:hypothetical protein